MGNTISGFLLSTVTIAITNSSVNLLASRGALGRHGSRKAMHILMGLLYLACWRAFPKESHSAPLVALSLPALMTVRFALIGAGWIEDAAAVRAMCRTGDRRELLCGPLLYGTAISLLTLIFWMRSPVGIVSISLLCAGDGFAEIVGNAIQGPKLPWSKKKTVSGTMSFIVAGALASCSLLWFLGVPHETSQVVAVAVGSAIAESLSSGQYDNAVVPLVSAVLGGILYWPIPALTN
eukprot:TRINITY_DN3556_c0_g1_i1.p1 TRINITY_DN3556_c0_g1~~TRINITY_DN3556_c0_g1_i1.p1  ORF type:complete len:236 (-),score=10.43 TRINITY_DN3556_c0_g1_i1:26-733(-)